LQFGPQPFTQVEQWFILLLQQGVLAKVMDIADNIITMVIHDFEFKD